MFLSVAAPMPHLAYLIDRWPDPELPLLERELEEMKRRNLPIVPFVCELNSGVRLNRQMQQIAPSLEFLPDAFEQDGGCGHQIRSANANPIAVCL